MLEAVQKMNQKLEPAWIEAEALKDVRAGGIATGFLGTNNPEWGSAIGSADAIAGLLEAKYSRGHNDGKKKSMFSAMKGITYSGQAPMSMASMASMAMPGALLAQGAMSMASRDPILQLGLKYAPGRLKGKLQSGSSSSPSSDFPAPDATAAAQDNSYTETHLDEYVGRLGDATGGAFGWHLTDEFRHVGARSAARSQGIDADQKYELIAQIVAERDEAERRIRADAGKGPAFACLKRAMNNMSKQQIDFQLSLALLDGNDLDLPEVKAMRAEEIKAMRMMHVMRDSLGEIPDGEERRAEPMVYSPAMLMLRRDSLKEVTDWTRCARPRCRAKRPPTPLPDPCTDEMQYHACVPMRLVRWRDLQVHGRVLP